MDKYEILSDECTICLDDLNEKKLNISHEHIYYNIKHV